MINIEEIKGTLPAANIKSIVLQDPSSVNSRGHDAPPAPTSNPSIKQRVYARSLGRALDLQGERVRRARLTIGGKPVEKSKKFRYWLSAAPAWLEPDGFVPPVLRSLVCTAIE